MHRDRPPPPDSRYSAPRPSPHALLFASRQYTSAFSHSFNQPLSLNTSSVTNMYFMFYVRSSLPRICSRALPCTPPPACQPGHLPPHRMPSLRLSAARVGVQPAAELRHLQRHEHGLHVHRALRACLGPQPSVGHSPAVPAACAAATAPHPPASGAAPRPTPYMPSFRLGRTQTPCLTPTSCSSVARGRAPRPSPPLAMARTGVPRGPARPPYRRRRRRRRLCRCCQRPTLRT